MNKKIILKICTVLVILVFISLFIITNISNADTGPKPSITITLENMDSQNYYIDLLTKMSLEMLVNYNEYNQNAAGDKNLKNAPIYKYDEGNWYATALRNPMLFGKVLGNREHVHTFSYFGTPDVFKVIIQMPDGTIRTSDVIERKDFNARYTIDVNTMEIDNNVSVIERFLDSFISIVPYIIIVLITVIAELIVAKGILKYKEGSLKENKKIIIITNILTNVAFQLITVSLPDMLDDLNIIEGLAYFDYYIAIFIIMEIIIFFGEYFTYKNHLKLENSEAVLKYTLTANIITAALTFVPVDLFLGMFIEAVYLVTKDFLINIF